jgi:hypothetical protein
MSGMVNPDILKSPIMSDELNVRNNGVSMLVCIDWMILSIDIIN